MVRKATPYGVNLIRGPFLDLPPHEHHAADVGEFKRLTKSLRGRGAHLAADLFSGAGGISLGLEEAGYDVVLGADHYEAAVRTHAHHFAGLSLDWDLADADVVERGVSSRRPGSRSSPAVRPANRSPRPADP